ncbi:MAG: thiamine pyrophosphate-dependent enzyme, partial [Candidatus Micrarchaeia archaeon]
MTTFEELSTIEKPTWCPGCGNWGILNAIKNAIVELNLPKHEVVIVSGIGCSGHLPQWINTYAFHSLHGRALPVAQAIKLSNHKLKVIAVGGDGDGYGIGIGHFIHAMRRNVDITYIVHNNQIYGLTTGQASPTSEKGFKTKSTPHGLIEPPINPIALALSSDCS